MVILLVSGNPDYALNRKQLDAFTQAMQEAVQPEKAGAQLSLFLRIQQCQKGKPTQFYEMELGGPAYIRELLTVGEKQFEFQISPTAFFQPNTRQAERLYAAALDLVQLPQSSHIYDLYAGTGTLGIIASSFVKIVTSIELVPEATLDAEANAKINNVDNLNILTGDVGEHLARLQREDSWESPDLIMVDPPRMGLDEQAIQHLFFAKPTQILYISCNPKTQAENVGELVKYGYQVTAVQAVDQFPHTVHVENIVVLRCG